jgi:formylglycine-generating enzyme required for sulfatase activity
LQNVGGSLLPPLAGFLEDTKRSAPERRTITNMYGAFAAKQPDAVADLEKRLAVRGQPEDSEEARAALAKRQAQVGAALVALGRGDKVWPLLRHTVQDPSDPTLRSYLIEQLAVAGADRTVLARRSFDPETEVSIRRAIVLSLGQLEPESLPLAEREQWTGQLLQVYRDDPDPGLHAAAEWLLRRWDQQDRLREIDQKLKAGEPEGNPPWYRSRQGHTMMKVPRPAVFDMGEGKEQHKRRIDRSYAIASKEVTVEQFRQFRKDHRRLWDERGTTADSPVDSVSWHDAAAYCNWLSEREKIPPGQWCYVPNPGLAVAMTGLYAQPLRQAVVLLAAAEDRWGNMGLAPRYLQRSDYLQRTGYRLPTGAEWEYACRAGATTPWSCGATEELLDKYAWTWRNSAGKSHPTGLLKPNDLGLFDMHGNVYEWCQEAYMGFREFQRGDIIEDKEDMKYIKDEESRLLLHGGAFDIQALDARSASGFYIGPANRSSSCGFRPARTYR